MPPTPLPDDCLLRPPALLIRKWLICWKLMILTHLLEERVVEEVSVTELCLNVSGKLLAGTVIV